MVTVHRKLALWAGVLVLSTTSLLASAGSITVLSPKAGEVWPAGAHELQYQVDPSPQGNHLHVYVDDQDEPIISHKISHCPCSVALPALKPGVHQITIKEATSGHSLTGVETHVSFSVK